MKKIFLISGLAVAALCSLTSCEDFIEADNKSNVDSDKYFESEKGINAGTTEAYYSLRNIYGSDVAMFVAGTDIYGRGRSGFPDTQLQEYKSIATDHGGSLNFYKNCYSGIQSCNLIIGKAGENANFAKQVDECRVIRALYYYLLSQQFGGVPIQTEYISSASKEYPRKSLQEVYDFIIVDLKAVLANGKLDAEDHTGRVSMQYVNNLLAKVCLAAGWDLQTNVDVVTGKVSGTTGTDYFKQAAQYADAAIGGRNFTLSYAEQWTTAKQNNDNEIFAIQYTRGIASQDEIGTGNTQQMYFGNYYVANKDDIYTKYTNSQCPPSTKLIYLYEPGDTRWDATFMVERLRDYMHGHTGITAADETLYWYPVWYELGENPTTKSVAAIYKAWREESPATGQNRETARIYSSSEPSFYQEITVNKRTGKITVKDPETQPYQESLSVAGTSLCVKKFDDTESENAGTSKVSYRNIVLAHLAETYLLAAEAYYMAGDEATSLKRLNVVRNRAFNGAVGELSSYAAYVRHYSDGTSVKVATGLDPIDVILDERARELCGEYYRWMDLRRTRKLIPYNVECNVMVDDAKAFVGPDGKYRMYRPFPQAEINLNNSITAADQNDGYRNPAAE